MNTSGKSYRGNQQKVQMMIRKMRILVNSPTVILYEKQNTVALEAK